MNFFINEFQLLSTMSYNFMFSSYWTTAHSITLLSYWLFYGFEFIFFFVSFIGLEGLWAFCVVVDFTAWAHILIIPLPIVLMVLSRVSSENYDKSLYDDVTFYWRLIG